MPRLASDRTNVSKSPSFPVAETFSDPRFTEILDVERARLAAEEEKDICKVDPEVARRKALEEYEKRFGPNKSEDMQAARTTGHVHLAETALAQDISSPKGGVENFLHLICVRE